MPSQVVSTVENSFTKGLVTEYTGLNFPENAATDTANCIYPLIGNVTRRQGFDWEANASQIFLDRTGRGISSYKWDNAGGDGNTQIVVQQVGEGLYFYVSSAASVAQPVSKQLLVSSINLTSFGVSGAVFDLSQECTFTSGNGYLFVFHPNCDTILVTYNPTLQVVTGQRIQIAIRDLSGIAFGESSTSTRPINSTAEHTYNLQNQGWSNGPSWGASYSNSWVININPSVAFTVAAGIIGVSAGQSVIINTLSGAYPPAGTTVAAGSIVSYVGTVLTVNVTTASYPGFTSTSGVIYPLNIGNINTFKAAAGLYPSNSDVWWYFKNSSGVFDPATTLNNITFSQGNAPRGSYILGAFYQDRSTVSGVPGLNRISTSTRPTIGAWFQGRVFYSGVNDSQVEVGDAPQYSWSENIYFSQIVSQVTDLGKCYQNNDPTSQTLNGLLSTDGGIIQIQGCGRIYKLFPLQNALIVFAANGVWYITGSQGIGFSATDYTIVKLSSVRSISSSSFVDVKGLPMFWNEEGIYSVQPAQQGTSLLNSPLHVNPLEVIPITVGTIQTYYDNIPLQSKLHVHGAYNPIDYVVQWVFRSANETSTTDRYSYDRILNYNAYNKSFYPHTFDISVVTTPSINGIIYVSSPGGSTSPLSAFKYTTSYLYSSGLYRLTFADEHDTKYVDWATLGKNVNYNSYFITGYKLHGQGQKKFSVPYIYIYSRNDVFNGYFVQSIWDYATDPNSGRWSNKQRINNFKPRFTYIFRRLRLRGSGYVMQIKVSSQNGLPFDIMGWSTYENLNQGV